ncbi:MAG: cupin domain-containing protein [Thermoplasmata archaeon]|nr:cupin domain-containing protein [Candidatus Sysuiplasma acidicola]MBX8646868.1 cupin domain-containing protein [Candidatus Sysuiplasma acidicola]
MFRTEYNIPRITRPGDILWEPHHVLPAGAKCAVLYGDPSREGAYVMRLSIPENVRIMPHSHTDSRIYTVLSGSFGIGFGDVFDMDELEELTEGSIINVPAGMNHFQYSESVGYIVQVQGIGPTDTVYRDAADDPRQARSRN